jgi:hypothetical protein
MVRADLELEAGNGERGAEGAKAPSVGPSSA